MTRISFIYNENSFNAQTFAGRMKKFHAFQHAFGIIPQSYAMFQMFHSILSANY